MNDSNSEELVLVDGSGYIFRAYYALPPMNRSDGLPVNAIFGFCNMLLKLIEDIQSEKGGKVSIAVIFDDMAAAFATVAFVAFISMLVDRTYTATQYALLASIGTAGRTTLAASSGALVDWLNGDWGIFFIITALMVIPSLIFLYMIRHKLKLND